MNTIVSIPGMHCRSCEALIRDVSLQYPAIAGVDVDLGSKRVMIQHDAHFNLRAWSREVESLDARYRVQTAK